MFTTFMSQTEAIEDAKHITIISSRTDRKIGHSADRKRA